MQKVSNLPNDSSVVQPAAFRTTHWSVVLRAGSNDSSQAYKALSTLCQNYWYPLYAFIRFRGHNPDDAKDLTQEFFSRLLEKNYLDAVDPGKGKFRSFLLACTQHFLSNERQKQQAIKRGGQFTFVPLDQITAENLYSKEPVDNLTPEKLYERRWALTVLERALGRVRSEYKDDEQQFEYLQRFLSGSKAADTSYEEAARVLGATEAAVRQAAHRMRRRFGQILRDEIAQTVSTPDEVDEELAHLQTTLKS